MNFQYTPALEPVRVLIINSLSSAGKLVVPKILNGSIFGKYQLIDLILLVYVNEKHSAEEFYTELLCCSFPCMNSIVISSDLPGYDDADVFLFLSNFKSPNCLNFDDIDTCEFDNLYLIIKIAHNLVMPEPKPKEEEKFHKRNWKPEPQPRKKLFWADGLLALDIIQIISTNLPPDIFLCPTPLNGMSKTILAEYLKTDCTGINHVYVWAANDNIFHVEVEKPYVCHDTSVLVAQTECDWDMIGRDLLESINLDHTQFNESWMKKDFMEKMISASTNNPYGDIGRAAVFTIGLRFVWVARSSSDCTAYYRSLGVISDGSLGTKKGDPYILPLILTGDTWTVNMRYEETYHLRQEIKRMNAVVREHHTKLVRYCKKFLQDNVLNEEFVPTDSSTTSLFSMSELTQRSRSNTNIKTSDNKYFPIK